MSKITKNGKNLVVETTISYNPKNDSIILTSQDEDMIGKPFYITLNKTTDAEKTLRDLLIKKGVISLEKIGQELPKLVEHPEKFDKSPYVFNIGVKPQGITQYDSTRDSNVLVSGGTGQGKTNIIKSFLKHAEKYSDEWNYFLLTPQLRENYSEFTKTSTKTSVNNIDDLNKELKNIVMDIQDEYKQIDPTLNHHNPKKLVVLDDLESIIISMHQNKLVNIYDRDKIIEASSMLEYIAKNGYRIGYRLIYSTTEPETLSGELKALMGTRIAMGKTTLEQSSSILGTSSGTRIPHNLGAGYHRTYGNGEFFQAYHN